MPIGKLSKRAEYQAARKGRRAEAPAFTLHAVERRGEAEPSPAKVGLTVTKKVGSAPERNRIKRRLRALVREAGEACGLRERTSYVLIARREALSHPFAGLAQDLARAVSAAHMPRRPKPGSVKPGIAKAGADEPAADVLPASQSVPAGCGQRPRA